MLDIISTTFFNYFYMFINTDIFNFQLCNLMN
jgi:hypothetical protein